jgi:hypothetical protein
MTTQRKPEHELTAKQRLALSRQALAQAALEPLWAGLMRSAIQRSIARKTLKSDQIG